MVSAHGFIASGFEAVGEAFAANFAERGEVGAAFAAMVDGTPVVDLWGGMANTETGEPWERDTIQVIFSGTKGLSALCVAMLMDRGLLDLDDRVAEHWPEFAENGKAKTTVAEALSHRARVPALPRSVTKRQILDSELMISLLASQPPVADPRAEVLYHAQTFGWLCDGLVRKVDGRSIGKFFADEVAGPLELDIWIGLPREQEPRVARLLYGPEWAETASGEDSRLGRDALYAAIYEEPPVFEPGGDSDIFFNQRAYHEAEMGASNGIGTARSIARLYGALALGGELDGVRIISSAALRRATEPLATEKDPLGVGSPESTLGAGFLLQTDEDFGPVEEAFGHPGAGGSCHGAWPREKVGFSYAMNELRAPSEAEERVRPLLTALHSSVAALPGA